MNDTTKTNRNLATRFIEAFNTNDWDVVREVAHPNYVFHHPLGGTITAGPEAIIAEWSGFKASLPDSWHPIPIMIAEGDYVAVLLPTYGHFTGKPHKGDPPTGKWLEYGMVNMVRFQEGKLVESWFGMDPLAEMQQMGLAPPTPPRPLKPLEKANLGLFQQTVNVTDVKYDKVTAIGDVVIALGPPQHEQETSTRKVEVFHADGGALSSIYVNKFTTNPPYAGDQAVDSEVSRRLMNRFFHDILSGHNPDALDAIVSPHILIHPTAMPCEAGYYGHNGLRAWLGESRRAFPDLIIADHFAIAQGDIVAARWTARGTSTGQFMMIPPSGQIVEFTGLSMYRLEDGKVAELWDTRNTVGIMRQLNPEIGAAQHAH